MGGRAVRRNGGLTTFAHAAAAIAMYPYHSRHHKSMQQLLLPYTHAAAAPCQCTDVMILVTAAQHLCHCSRWAELGQEGLCGAGWRASR